MYSSHYFVMAMVTIQLYFSPPNPGFKRIESEFAGRVKGQCLSKWAGSFAKHNRQYCSSKHSNRAAASLQTMRQLRPSTPYESGDYEQEGLRGCWVLLQLDRDQDAHLAHIVLVHERPLHRELQRRVDGLDGKSLEVGDSGAWLNRAGDAVTTGLRLVQGERDGDTSDHAVHHSLQGSDLGTGNEREAELCRGVPLKDAEGRVAAASSDLDVGVVHFALTATIPNSNSE